MMFFTQPTCVHTEHVRTSGHVTSRLDFSVPRKKGTALYTAHRKSVVKDPYMVNDFTGVRAAPVV